MVLMPAPLTTEPLLLPPMMVSMELMLTDMVLLLTTVLELGVQLLSPVPGMVLMLIMVGIPAMASVLLLTTLLLVTMASDTLALMVTILQLSLWVITAMEPTVLGELL